MIGGIMKKTEKAFTLAEVLITIGIIGIVSALTIPNLLVNIRNRDLQVQLKKTYSEWNQIAMNFMETEDQDIPSFTSEKGVAKLIETLPKYIKGVTKISDWSFFSKSDDPDVTYIDLLPYTIYEFSGKKVNSMACDELGFRSDITGKYIMFDNKPIAGTNGPRLCIDLNGSKKPNTVGIDIFSFQFTTDGHVIPEGMEHKDNNYGNQGTGGTFKASATTCRKGQQWTNSPTCAFYAINDQAPNGKGTYWKDFIGKKLYK